MLVASIRYRRNIKLQVHEISSISQIVGIYASCNNRWQSATHGPTVRPVIYLTKLDCPPRHFEPTIGQESRAAQSAKDFHGKESDSLAYFFRTEMTDAVYRSPRNNETLNSMGTS
jgi:hypothetical protein